MASLVAAAFCWGHPRPARAKKAGCQSLDECRDRGDEVFEASEKAKGPIVRMSSGVRYRESRVGIGPAAAPGDTVDISYEVRKTNGDYIFSFGRGRPDAAKDDFGESYRVRLGSLDAPLAVEMAMVGMRPGGVRVVEVPPQLGFETSGWKPEPSNFSGKQRMLRYRQLLTGNGLQPGYNAALQFEVEVMRLRPAGSETTAVAAGTSSAAAGAKS